MAETQCKPEQFEFQGLGRRRVVAAFDGGAVTTEAGGLLLGEVERATGLVEKFAGCFQDGRAAGRVEHSLRALIAQRVFALALGFEDLNDHERLREDPVLGLLSRKLMRGRGAGAPLAGKSTLNRLERGGAEGTSRYHKIRHEAGAIDRLLVDHFLDAHPKPPKEVVLDLDATDDPLHGDQEGRFFHGYYRHYCYLPLYIFAGGFLLGARLRPSRIDESAGAKEELQRITAQIRARWPKARILIRADSAFAREVIMAWCEKSKVDYVLGLAKNDRLVGAIEAELEEARLRCRQTGAPARLFKEIRYRTLKSWSRARRVVAKAEHLPKGANPRFVVTSLTRRDMGARALYERLYCARGEMENRIKEQQLDLFADRTSAATLRANQLRLYFSSIAYLLLHGLRRLALGATQLARATCGTIRLRLLKIGARVRVSVRRIAFSLASGHPAAGAFAAAWRALAALPPA